jgi:hypothetical protein
MQICAASWFDSIRVRWARRQISSRSPIGGLLKFRMILSYDFLVVSIHQTPRVPPTQAPSNSEIGKRTVRYVTHTTDGGS